MGSFVTVLGSILSTLLLAALYWGLAKWTRGHKREANMTDQIEFKNSVGIALFGFISGSLLTAFGVGLGCLALIHHETGWIWLAIAGWIIIFGAGIIVGGQELFDRSAKIRIDQSGIHDLRTGGRNTSWTDLADIKLEETHRRGIVSAARLALVMKAGDKRELDIAQLDEEPKWILEKVRAMWLRWSRCPEASPARPDSNGLESEANRVNH
jgi:hypothetical protein